ncbi:SLC26A/SulP transporter family protein [Rhizobacter sp. Root404]|uniref:SLC26A/SulP transporter family protein n=1 Tax=Rhizobacter sp. Root404 TaxID=1736528 RepID=UPI000ACDA824|nr:SulP family inorganic anion transporter [Rhizobacter sp. Root404]
MAVLSNAVAHAPETAAYGLLAFAPLGVAFAPVAMGLALLGSVVANVVASALGAGRLVSGPRAALALLTAALVAALVAALESRHVMSTALVLTLCAIGVVGAGALQVGFGLLRLGNIVKYTPHPVRVGVTSGVGLLLIITALPVMTGHGFGTGWRAAFDAPQPGAIVVGLFAIAVSSLAGRLQQRVPAVLLGLGAAGLLHAVLVAQLPGGGFGALLGVPALPALAFSTTELGAAWHSLRLGTQLAALLGAYALTVAVLCSLDSLLVVSVIDGRLRRSRDPNRELCSQGVANIFAGLASGQPFSPSMLRTLALVVPNPNRRHLVLAYGIAVLALLLGAPGLIALIPGSAIGGVLLLQGVQMVAPAFWRAPLELWRLQHRRRAPGGAAASPSQLRGGDWAIELAVAFSAVFLGLGPAVVIGASCAVLLFVRANMRDVVRHEWTVATRRSLKARPAVVVEVLVRAGPRITLLDLEGPLFFGTADGLRARLDLLEDRADTVILDLHRVTDIDVTAARILFETAEHWERRGRHLVFSEAPAGDPRRLLIEAAGSAPHAPSRRFVDHTDLALEQAEERLLASLEPTNAGGRILTLAETMLGRGLDGGELDWLGEQLRTLHIPRGELLFRLGDPGDGLYLSLAGDIGLRMPGSERRLASFAPGVVIGEMATLTRGTRSAEAYAESDVTALKLSADDFERLMIERPVLAAKLLKSMSLHLADRVRTLTGDLSHWVSRPVTGA